MTNFQFDSKSIEDDVIRIQYRSLSDPPLSDIYFINKMAWVWTTLKVEKIESPVKSSPDQSHFILEINVGEGWIQHRTTQESNF